MALRFRFWRSFASISVLSLAPVAVQVFAPRQVVHATSDPGIAGPVDTGFCPVAPIPELRDRHALAFEESTTSLSTSGLTPRTARALTRFFRLVRSVGGAMDLKSAYRPAAYQAHLRSVWESWMWELRDNTEPACASLRAQVYGEFTRHHLLQTQRPVPLSDHTLGIGFDAAVTVPPGARLHRRRVTVDKLARMCGVSRPDIFRDPVHFRLIHGRGSRG